MLTPQIIAGLIHATREAAQSEIMPRFRRLDPGQIETKSGPEDLVTIADRQAEVFIADRVRALLPEALIIGEEAVAANPDLLNGLATAPTTVIIDPIDGTSNFAKGVAVFGVILAVMHHGNTIFGLLYDPIADDWVQAQRGAGVQFVRGAGGLVQTLDPPAPPADVPNAEGFVALSMFDHDARCRISAGYPDFRRILSWRCSCHEYRMLAQGHGSFILNAGDKPWDHAAGALILEELGGGVWDRTGHRYDPASSKGPLWAFNFGDVAKQDQIRRALGEDKAPGS